MQDVLKLLPDEVAAKIDPAQFVRYFISGSTIYTVIDRPNNGGALCLQPNHTTTTATITDARTPLTTYHLTLASRCADGYVTLIVRDRTGKYAWDLQSVSLSQVSPSAHDTRHTRHDTRHTAHDVRES